jgi:hypothetical protein
MGGAAGISRSGQPSDVEMVSIENISDHGVRIVTPRQLQSGEGVVIYSQNSLSCSVAAKVVYCQPLPDGRFAIGCVLNEGNGIQLFAQRGP